MDERLLAMVCARCDLQGLVRVAQVSPAHNAAAGRAWHTWRAACQDAGFRRSLFDAKWMDTFCRNVRQLRFCEMDARDAWHGAMVPPKLGSLVQYHVPDVVRMALFYRKDWSRGHLALWRRTAGGGNPGPSMVLSTEPGAAPLYFQGARVVNSMTTGILVSALHKSWKALRDENENKGRGVSKARRNGGGGGGGVASMINKGGKSSVVAPDSTMLGRPRVRVGL